MAFRVADLIVDTLIAHGVDRVFSVPGESFLALLDALYERDEIDLVTCRHEGSASLAAVADAKLTGRAGVVMVSRGPGASNAVIRPAAIPAGGASAAKYVACGPATSRNTGRSVQKMGSPARPASSMGRPNPSWVHDLPA